MTMHNVIFEKRRKGARVVITGSIQAPQVMLELPNGLSDWPVRYEDSHIAYDLPGVPGYAKKLAEDAYHWLDSQWERQGVVGMLETLLRGPISEGQLNYMRRRMPHGGSQLNYWLRITDGMVSILESAREQATAYVNAWKHGD